MNCRGYSLRICSAFTWYLWLLTRQTDVMLRTVVNVGMVKQDDVLADATDVGAFDSRILRRRPRDARILVCYPARDADSRDMRHH